MQVSVGPLDLKIVESANKGFLNFIIKHVKRPLRRRLEEELNKQLVKNMEAMCVGLNEQLQKQLVQTMRESTTGNRQISQIT